MKDILDLNFFKVTNNPTLDREGKKVNNQLYFFFHFTLLGRTDLCVPQSLSSTEYILEIHNGRVPI